MAMAFGGPGGYFDVTFAAWADILRSRRAVRLGSSGDRAARKHGSGRVVRYVLLVGWPKDLGR